MVILFDLFSQRLPQQKITSESYKQRRACISVFSLSDPHQEETVFMSSPQFKAVIFDIGGVVLRSPFIGIAKYEQVNSIPDNYLNCSIVARGPQGAWQRFERGELDLFSFYEDFSADLSDAVNGNVWYLAYCKRKGIDPPVLPTDLSVDGRELFGHMMRESNAFDPHVLQAIRHLRKACKHKVIALTNNFATVFESDAIPHSELAFLGREEADSTSQTLLALFDDYCDSSVLGMRKPETEFYIAACERNGIKPHEAVFLDDIGMNLKPAKTLGMETIHVPIGGTLDAIKKLERIIGLDLTSSLVSESSCTPKL